MSNSWKKFTQLRIHVVESKNHPCPTTAEIEVGFLFIKALHMIKEKLLSLLLRPFFIIVNLFIKYYSNLFTQCGSRQL